MATRALRIVANETGAELTQSFRAPEFLFPTLALPIGFYLFFGVMVSRGTEMSAYLLATYGVFSVMGPALFGFGVGVASERERGWLELKRAAPTPGLTFIGAKLMATLAFAAMALIPLYLAAAALGDVRLPRATWLGLMLVHLSAVIPFALVGLTIGFRVGANGAIAIVNIIFFAFAVLGGLWFPANLFPDWMQAISHALPSYHLAEVALSLVEPNSERPMQIHAAVVLAMSLALAAAAAWAWRRQP